MGRLLRTFGIYFMGTIVNRLMGFVVMSIATFQILPDDYGYFTIANNMINILMTLISVQAWMAIIRFVFDYDTRRGKRKVVSTGLFIDMVAFAIYSVGFFIVACSIHLKDASSIYFLGASYMLVQNMTFACRGLGYNKLFVYSGIFGSANQLIFCMIFIFGLHWGSAALILATAMSYFTQGLFIEIFLQNFRKFRLRDVDFPLMKKMLRYCIPTSLNQGSYWINTQACTLIISLFLGKSAVGIYSAPSKLTSLIGMVVLVFNYAWQEFTFSISRSEEREKQYNEALDQFIRFISCGMLLLIPITSVFFTWIIGPKYADGKDLVPLLYLGTCFDSLASFLGSVMQAEKRVNILFLSQAAGAAVTVLVMVIAIPYIGLQAAGLAMILCFFTVIFIRVYGLRNRVRLHINSSFLLHYALAFALTSCVYLFFGQAVNFGYLFLVLIYCGFCLRKTLSSFKDMALGRKQQGKIPKGEER